MFQISSSKVFQILNIGIQSINQHIIDVKDIMNMNGEPNLTLRRDHVSYHNNNLLNYQLYPN